MMKKRKAILPLLLVVALSSCAMPKAEVKTAESTKVIETTYNHDSRIDKIAREIGYDNYMKGVWKSIDFNYKINQVASVGTTNYFTIDYTYDFGKKYLCYVKVALDKWEVVREFPYQP